MNKIVRDESGKLVGKISDKSAQKIFKEAEGEYVTKYHQGVRTHYFILLEDRVAFHGLLELFLWKGYYIEV